MMKRQKSSVTSPELAFDACDYFTEDVLHIATETGMFHSANLYSNTRRF